MKAHFSKRQLLESHLQIADYGVASFEGFKHNLPWRTYLPECSALLLRPVTH